MMRINMLNRATAALTVLACFVFATGGCFAEEPDDPLKLKLEAKLDGSEGSPLTLDLTMSFRRDARIYLHERFGLEEQLGGYLVIRFTSQSGESFELASWAAKTMYPSASHVRDVAAGTQISEQFVLGPESAFYFRTATERSERLLPGKYSIVATYDVPVEENSKKLGLDPVSDMAPEVLVVVQQPVDLGLAIGGVRSIGAN